MSQTEQNKALARRWFDEVWNQGKQSAIEELFLPEGRCYGFPTYAGSISRSEFEDVHREFQQTFSNICLSVDDLVAEGDRVAVRWSLTMDHTGHGLGHTPTGKQVNLAGGGILQYRDGRILNGWNHIDMQHLTNQLQ